MQPKIGVVHNCESSPLRKPTFYIYSHSSLYFCIFIYHYRISLSSKTKYLKTLMCLRSVKVKCNVLLQRSSGSVTRPKPQFGNIGFTRAAYAAATKYKTANNKSINFILKIYCVFLSELIGTIETSPIQLKYSPLYIH